jgi:hypothetical protein
MKKFLLVVLAAAVGVWAYRRWSLAQQTAAVWDEVTDEVA